MRPFVSGMMLVTSILCLTFTRFSFAGFGDRIRAKIQKRIEEKTPNKGNYSFERKTFSSGGREREYLVYKPTSLSNVGRHPVIINFHGGMGWAEQQADMTKMNEVADKFGFIVVYPNGTGKLKTRGLTFNVGRCCGYARDQKVDDIGFVRELIIRLPTEFPIDAQRIYVSGFSNGAMLAYRTAIELSNLVAGVAAVSGAIGDDGVQPKNPVPIIHFHGLKDQNAAFEGGKGKNQFDSAPHKPVMETIRFWVKANHCDPNPAITVEKEYTIEHYSPRGGVGAPVILVKFPEGGHTWPGGAEIGEKLKVGTLIKTFSASRYLWDFLKEFKLGKIE